MSRTGWALLMGLIVVILAMLVPGIDPVVGFLVRLGGVSFCIYVVLELIGRP